MELDESTSDDDDHCSGVGAMECLDMLDDIVCQQQSFELPDDNGSSDTESCGHDAEQGMVVESSSEKDGSSVRSEPAGGMDLDQGSDTNMESAVESVSGWRPGRDCGRFDSFDEPLVKVILTNLFLNVSRLPSALTKTLLEALLPKGARSPIRNFPDRVIQMLTGVSQSRGRRTHDQVRDNGWDPCKILAEPSGEQHGGDDAAHAESAFQFANGCATTEERSLWALGVRVKESIDISRKGRYDRDYPSALRRLQSHGLVLGKKYRSKHFVEPVEELCVAAVQSLTAHSMDQLVPSIGILADFSVVFDGVSIGARMFSRYETMMLLGVVLMEDTGGGVWREVPHLLGAPSAGQMHTGEEQVELILQALADHPAHLTVEKMLRRLARVGSDGAACQGGENSIHPSTKSSEKIWRRVYPEAAPLTTHADPTVEWDLFHRIDRAVSKAIEDTPAAIAIFDVSRAIGALFGVGDGRVILRATADAIGERRLRVPDQGGTRKVVALANTVEHLLKMHRTLHAAMHARLGQRKAHRGSQTEQKLVDVGRHIAALGFVTFTLGVGDLFRTCVTPLAMLSQAVEGGSRAMDVACRTSLENLTKAKAALEKLQFWCFAATLLCTRLSRQDLQSLWRAVAFSQCGRSFPRLAVSLRQLLFAQEFGGCTLNPSPSAQHLPAAESNFLAPFCQCPCMRRRRCPLMEQTPLTRVRVARKDGSCVRFINVPEWVGNSAYPRKEMLESATQAFQVPRLIQLAMEQRPPSELQGASRFRRVCKVPAGLLLSAPELLKALHELQCFIERLLYYMHAYAMGSTGMNQHMRTIAAVSFVSCNGAMERDII